MDWRSCLSAADRLGKLPLRRSLARHSSYQTIPKKGFSVPIDRWLRGPLRQVFEQNVLARETLLGLEFDRKALGDAFSNHLDGSTNMGWGLWTVLSLALWEKEHFKRHI